MMRIRVLRRLTVEEVRRRIRELERKYGGRLTEPSDRSAEGWIERLEDYLEWSGMMNALRAYDEEGESEYYVEETWELPAEDLSKLTPKRLELLDALSRSRFSSISELAEHLRRDVKNVYLDLKALEGLGLIRLRRHGRSLTPELRVEELTLLLG